MISCPSVSPFQQCDIKMWRDKHSAIQRVHGEHSIDNMGLENTLKVRRLTFWPCFNCFQETSATVDPASKCHKHKHKSSIRSHYRRVFNCALAYRFFPIDFQQPVSFLSCLSSCGAHSLLICQNYGTASVFSLFCRRHSRR